MATLNQKTDEIAALEALNKDLSNWEMKLKNATKKEVQDKIKAKIKGIRAQIREGKTTDKEVSAKQLADSLLRSRKKFLEMSKKDFNGVIRQLAKRPEYAFLKGYTRQEIIDDIQRKAKPVGWRFKGRGNYKTPTPAQVRRGRALGTVYYENRPNRSDVSQTKQLEKGGYADSESPKHVLHIDGQNWYLEKIDSTHFYMSNSPDYRGMAHHIGQHKGEPYYEEVREWLKTTYEGGGEIKEGNVVKYNGYQYIVHSVDSNGKLNLHNPYKGYMMEYLIDPKDVEFESVLPFEKGGSTYAEGGEIKPTSYQESDNGIYEVKMSDGEIVIVDFSLEDFEEQRNKKDIFAQAKRNYEPSTYARGGEVSWDEKAGKPNVIVNGKEHGSISSAIEYYTLNSKKENPNAEKNKSILIKLKKLQDGSTYAKGGSMKGEILPYCIYVTNTNNPNENSELVAKVKAKGDALLITSELNKSLHKDTPLVYTMKEKKYEDGGSIPMSMSQLQAMREADFDFDNDVNDYYDDGVTRQYFEDEAYSYSKGGKIAQIDEILSITEDSNKYNRLTNIRRKLLHKIRLNDADVKYLEKNGIDTYSFENGGEIDINDLDIPVHYTMFEEELYEYGKGGNINDHVDSLKKGDTLTIKFGSSMSSNNKVELEVRSRNKVKNGTIDKITFVNKANPTGVKYYAYNRGNGWSFAKGDMGISNIEIV